MRQVHRLVRFQEAMYIMAVAEEVLITIQIQLLEVLEALVVVEMVAQLVISNQQVAQQTLEVVAVEEEEQTITQVDQAVVVL